MAALVTCTDTWLSTPEDVPTFLIFQVQLYRPVTINHWSIICKFMFHVWSYRTSLPCHLFTTEYLTVELVFELCNWDEVTHTHEGKLDTSSHKNCLFDSSNIIYRIPEHQMSKNEEDSTWTKWKKTEYLNNEEESRVWIRIWIACMNWRVHMIAKCLSRRNCVHKIN